MESGGCQFNLSENAWYFSIYSRRTRIQKNKGAEYLANGIYRFVDQLNDKNKQFKYRRRGSISYFPKTSLTTEELFSDKRWGDHFFNTKPLLWNPRGEVQEELF